MLDCIRAVVVISSLLAGYVVLLYVVFSHDRRSRLKIKSPIQRAKPRNVIHEARDNLEFYDVIHEADLDQVDGAIIARAKQTIQFYDVR